MISEDQQGKTRGEKCLCCETALAIIRQCGGEGKEYAFPSGFAARGPVARNSLSQALRRVIDGLCLDGADRNTVECLKANPPTPHDLRRTVASGLAALGIPREDRLAVLAHTIGDVHGRVYDRHDRFTEKRRALGLWEKHLSEIVEPKADAGNVVPMRTAK